MLHVMPQKAIFLTAVLLSLLIVYTVTVDSLLEQDVWFKIIILSWQCSFSCTSGAQCKENSIQPIGELSQNEGYLAVCLGGSWGKVCGGICRFREFPELFEEAIVVCRQLGFRTEGW